MFHQQFDFLKSFANNIVKEQHDTSWSSEADTVKSISFQLNEIIAAYKRKSEN